VVPGITAASAMAARLGVSLTHRDHAQGVRLVTAHARDGRLPQTLDWKGLAMPHATTIYYMPGRTAGLIAERLIAQGMPRDTPAVIVSAVTRRNEKRWSGSLDEMANAMQRIGFEEPVLLGIGAVFGRLGRAAGGVRRASTRAFVTDQGAVVAGAA